MPSPRKPFERRVLIAGADGLRPDLIDPAVMPTYARIMEKGVRFTDYHSVYPTHTRVIATTMSTGCHPGTHGIVANVFRYDGAREDGIINTGEYQHIQALDDFTGYRAVKVPSIGDLLARHGKMVGISGSFSGGSASLWSRRHAFKTVTSTSTLGRADLEALWREIGPPPEIDRQRPSMIGHVEWSTQMVIDRYLDDPSLPVILFYATEPDFSLHYYGLGSPEVDEAMAACDRALASVLEAIEARGLSDQFDVILLSDHGHSTASARRSLAEHLDRARVEIGNGLPQLTTASDYLYPEPGEPVPTASEIEPLVRWFQDQPFTGAIFARQEYAGLPGMIPLAALWNGVEGDRAPLLSISPAWSSDANERGVPGMVAALTEHAALRSTHGSASPYEIHALGAAIGPSFREGVTSDLPAGAVDILPTVLALLGLDRPAWLDGRVLWEAMSVPEGEPGERTDEEIGPANGSANGFAPSLHLHRVGTTTYIHQARNGNGAAGF